MAKANPFKLFVYGTLMDPSVFRAVTGRELVHRAEELEGPDVVLATEAILDGYKKVSPDGAYMYAVPDNQGRIRGLLIGPLPGDALAALRRYEGRNYSRKRLSVLTKDGPIEAVVFVGNLKQLQHSFGYEFRDPLKQEVLLNRKIDAALEETQQEQLHTTEQDDRRAVGELRGSTIRDLMRQHFEGGGISDYAIRHSLKDSPLRDFNRIASDPHALAMAPNYLRMVIRQVLFNQYEERVRRDFRYELDHVGLSKRYYDRTISSLVALRMLNNDPDGMDELVNQCLGTLTFPRDHLIDFVRWSIQAADNRYDRKLAKQQLYFIITHMGRGYVSLGAELEFSDIGHGVIHSPAGAVSKDSRFDGFYYFRDFGLDVLTWKLGGHVDDHHAKHSEARRRGFFEVALGNLSIEANISKPITDDPWLLNQFIHETRRFFPIRPHSVHMSLQLRTQQKPDQDRVLPLGCMKCLFAIGSELRPGDGGHWTVGRMASDEIIGYDSGGGHMLFSEVRKRFSSEDRTYPAVGSQQTGKYVQQFRFLRLSEELNYEPIAMGLKGLQASLRPGTFLTAAQYTGSNKHRKLFEELLHWGRHPEPLTPGEIESFLGPVYEGLMIERRGKPAHGEAYIAWAIVELRDQLEAFNTKLRGKAGGA